MNNLVIRSKAKKDIDNIWLYTYKNWSQAQADRYIQLIFNEIEFISSNFDLCREMVHIRASYRMSKVKSHLIFFRETNGTIEVVRILHQSMDLKRHI